jgi:hypothetical protein
LTHSDSEGFLDLVCALRCRVSRKVGHFQSFLCVRVPIWPYIQWLFSHPVPPGYSCSPLSRVSVLGLRLGAVVGAGVDLAAAAGGIRPALRVRVYPHKGWELWLWWHVYTLW